jgi:hypothetical protein
MDPFQLAQLLAAANAPSSGGADLAHHRGEILSWDESTGLNSVKVNGAAVSNLLVLQSGIGIVYQPGDTVMVEKRMSQWYILGKVAAPGAGAASQIVSNEVVASQTTGSTTYTDLGTVGPSVSVYIGSSRRCIVLFGCGITVADTGAGANNYVGGSAVFNVSGASTIAAAAGVSAQIWSPSGAPTGGAWTSSKPKLLTAANGLNTGMNTFTLQYRSNLASPVCGFIERHITVIPY